MFLNSLTNLIEKHILFSDPVVIHELPRRVFAPLPQADLCVCDYQFHSDTAVDSLDAFKELLNLELTEQDIDTSCEVSPSKYRLITRFYTTVFFFT